MLNSVATSLAGWMARPFILAPFAVVIGRSSAIFWSLVGTFACQTWGAEMTGPDDFIPFTVSRVFYGIFRAVPAILGGGYIVDMFFLHQRGKAFAVFEVLIIFAVVGGGTLGGFIAQTKPWNYVFWRTLGPVGAAIVAVFCFVEGTTFNRGPGAINSASLPEKWVANRIVTFFPGTRTQPAGKTRDLKRREMVPFQIIVASITLLVDTFVSVALDIPIMQASTLAIYLQPPTVAGGYGFSSLQLAFFTMTAWVGIIGAQLYGYLFNDKTPL